MADCCTHCRLKDLAEPPFDEIVGEWPNEVMLPRWLTSDAATWVTREGRVIPIVQLGDSHLYNIYRMLGRIQAQMDEADEEGHPIGGGPPVSLFDTKYAAIEEEMDRRNIPKGVPA
ncbi:hypothetical protein LCGC14_2303540 [marine sediment metagenome]|uniref:Uncharacterized protein n=1 Tax=marine sediment metagenome TaxID=412755 RepID=A0A0F9CMQ3_9ZZZZ